MDKNVYVCTGTCSAEVSQEEFENGVTQCGTDGCNMKGHAFEKRVKCVACGNVRKDGESHSH
ncbi:hypothetical protein A2415_02490 [candidate division WWE3 bacterium RIFOXYC1_FULL_39_7]|uniref:Uncharacterized protein n=2 Tax=Katanobacteria TaxID=422282 RepID=A0A1F4X3C5_UNCKA|nr:MAG: hypothetical protein A2415_02490 [candidate division WWE3 bacterium RIFOXYC1_FULL_39_7]OGC76165.1 MAG: hypothetical protein A2619_05615 [candidate division WWE3 bacterium RIFOXYD1_FULL_39_9]